MKRKLIARLLTNASLILIAAMFYNSSHGIIRVDKWGEWPDSLTIAEQLIIEHECWTGDAPKGAPIPSRAVATLDPRKGPEVVPADVGFEIWLEGRPGNLFAFCP